jgi:hypothetical protein
MSAAESPMMKAALRCVQFGWFVFPLVERGKQPDAEFAPHGFQSASNDSNVVRGWWTRKPFANIGIDLGRSNLTVLDFDKGTPPAELNLPETLQVSTSRGTHVYFAGTSKQGNMNWGGVHVGEIKSAGGYVLTVSSVHPDGPTYNLTVAAPVVPLPDGLIERLRPTTKSETPRNEHGLIAHGNIHNWMLSQAGRLRAAGCNRDEIETTLLRLVHEHCEPPIDEEKVSAMARSICNYEPGTSGYALTMSQKPNAPAGSTNQNAEPTEDEEPEESFDNTQDEFPRCPIFPGALSELARAMFPSLPLDFKQWGMISRWGLMRSGIDTFGIEKHLQPRFYSVLVSKPNRGKTASINETRNAFEIIYGMMKSAAGKLRVCGEPESIPSVDSGQFFSDEFARMVKASKAAYEKGEFADLAGKMMLDPDELSDVFEKGRVTQGRVSTMFIELLKLHSGNRTGSGTKKDGKSAVTNAHLSILAGTTVRKYPMLWTGTGGGADGLVSRFIPITTNNPPVPPVPLPSDFATAEKMYVRLSRLAELPGQTIMLDDEASKMLTDWWGSFDSGKESATRVLETIKQLLIVLAVTNLPENHQGTTVTVDADLMTYAIQFGEYVIAVRELINPGDSWSIVQAMENTIIDWAKKHTSKTDPKTMRDARRGIHPERLPGGLGTFKMAWRNCVETDVLKVRDKGHKGNGKYSM